MHDCGSKRGIAKRAIYKGDEVDVPLRDRIFGRVARETHNQPHHRRSHHRQREPASSRWKQARKIEDLGIDCRDGPLAADHRRRDQGMLRARLRHGPVHRQARRDAASPSASSVPNPSVSRAPSSPCGPSTPAASPPPPTRSTPSYVRRRCRHRRNPRRQRSPQHQDDDGNARQNLRSSATGELRHR